jgi:aspartyl-tRNA(Asn)/glutamyl-tRNA(Gln) amidotransferase subunit A
MSAAANAMIELTAAAAAERVRAGELDPGELFEAYRQRAAGETLNAFLWLADAPDGGPAPRSAPLGGVPLAVKDLFCVRDVPSQAASRILEGYRPPYTATVVQRLADAGAPLLGKTNQDEFAMGSSNENSAFGAVRNPWDPSRVPGGSSGGSAAAVAAGLAPWAIGTDTGGSIRQPAALCGVVGLKPTYGACSRYGMIAFASSLDQAGPITRDVTDAALLLRHMAGRDRRDSTSIALPEEIRLPAREQLRGVRLGVPEELAGREGGIEPGVLARFEQALSLARELGATVEPCRLPHAPHALSAYYLIAPAEASANLARFDGVRYGLRVDGSRDLLEMYCRTRAAGFGAEVKRRIMLGTYALSSGYYDAYYGTAQKVRTKISDDFRAAFERFDFIATPTSPWVAFELGAKTADPLAMYLNDFCTVPMSLAGIPAISIPCGLSGGLPVGLQLAGPAFCENALLDCAFALERALGFDGSVARGAGAAAAAPTDGHGPAPTAGHGPAPTAGHGPAPTDGHGPAPTAGHGPAPTEGGGHG